MTTWSFTVHHYRGLRHFQSTPVECFLSVDSATLAAIDFVYQTLPSVKLLGFSIQVTIKED